mmetsp:Transcript_11821/g.33947  ORF Transcript_11821/g.33947 Transcript_11821/m.33947 type:complete len:386 (-) Transcript_11821:190-1347(-)|eukprot:CAMPEP_0172369496 /NCGR_PEP_ID=MMETSP1060-20121228/33220_1 /TAXON_ID=37318 /ORGANISM="Pseudo-nitzschia pungens, Strain cf. cingulata" /LENGTH=385 /DNA_ID=CAMNT_0013094441 /DNA_START=96 /DNA_END=1253 /DNA_ORIENTATION=-
MTKSSSKQTYTASQMLSTSAITLPTVLLVVSALSMASALQCSGASLAVKPNIPVCQTTARPYSRSYGTEIYGSRGRSLSSPTSFSRVARKQQPTSALTQLQFSDDGDSNVHLESSWWRKIFTAPHQSSASVPNTDTKSTSMIKSEEQESVDAYLEFLDRRYRRLHCGDDNEGKAKSALQNDSSEEKTTKSFSAMDWLMKGSGSNNSNAVTTTRQQQEDALYVLGVAGLASQKLLQKHQLPTTMNQQQKDRTETATIDKVVELKEQIDDAIEVSSNTSLRSDVNSMILNNVLLPVIRILYWVQRQKQLLFRMIRKGVKAVATKAANGVVETLSQEPASMISTILSIGGGKQNILRTVTVGYTTVLVFRPLLHAMFAEGLVFEPLMK